MKLKHPNNTTYTIRTFQGIESDHIKSFKHHTYSETSKETLQTNHVETIQQNCIKLNSQSPKRFLKTEKS